jgi:hypothetical protein
MNTTTEQNGLGHAETREEILDVVCGLIDEVQRGYTFDRRKHDRHSLAITVKATPIKAGRLGVEFEALTHDISAGGLSFVYDARIDAPNLLLRFPGFDQPPLILEIVHQMRIGPFWKIGGRFRTAL